ncbi:MAG: SLATT domain-containing protein [Pseudomonadota bacterium]
MQDILETLDRYQRTYGISARGHYRNAELKNRRHFWLGVPAIVISAIVGASIFGTIEQQNVHPYWYIAAGMLSVTASVLASLQTFFSFSEMAEKHLIAARRYASIRRKTRLLKLVYAERNPDQRDNALKDLEDLIEELKVIAEESPAIPDKVYDAVLVEFANDNPELAGVGSRPSK